MSDTRETFAIFNEKANRLSQGLKEIGVSPGDVVAVMMPNCPEFLHSLFAIAKLGAVTAAINTGHKGGVLSHMIKLCAARVLILDECYVEHVAAISGSLVKLRTVVVREGAGTSGKRLGGIESIPYKDMISTMADNPQRDISDFHLAMILFTSGTTGPSKGCMLSHRYLVHLAELTIDHAFLKPTDTIFTALPLFHVDGLGCNIVPAILLGAKVAVSDRFSASKFWGEVRHYGATVFEFMGAVLTILSKQPHQPSDRDNPIRVAWGYSMPDLASKFEERFNLKLIECYGLTDSGNVIFHPLGEPRRQGSCGKAHSSYDVRVFDEEDREVIPGETGEIVIRPLRPSIMMNGYYNMAEETLGAFRNSWFHTGDFGRTDKDGYFYFVARKKDAIRRRGENISAFEIEVVIDRHPAVFESAAIGVPSELTDEDVKLFVVLRPGHMISPEDLISYCKERMARHMLPRFVEFIDELPKTSTQKVEKYKLRDRETTSQTWDRESLH